MLLNGPCLFSVCLPTLTYWTSSFLQTAGACRLAAPFFLETSLLSSNGRSLPARRSFSPLKHPQPLIELEPLGCWMAHPPRGIPFYLFSACAPWPTSSSLQNGRSPPALVPSFPETTSAIKPLAGTRFEKDYSPCFSIPTTLNSPLPKIGLDKKTVLSKVPDSKMVSSKPSGGGKTSATLDKASDITARKVPCVGCLASYANQVILDTAPSKCEDDALGGFLDIHIHVLRSSHSSCANLNHLYIQTRRGAPNVNICRRTAQPSSLPKT